MNNTSDINDNFVISRAVLSDVSCTSCASVIERHFTKEDGITVSINFATKKHNLVMILSFEMKKN